MQTTRTEHMPRAWFAVAFAVLAAFAPPAVAQSYPQKPIHLIVPFPPGGIADVLSRIIGTRLTEAWGQPVLIEN